MAGWRHFRSGVACQCGRLARVPQKVSLRAERGRLAKSQDTPDVLGFTSGSIQLHFADSASGNRACAYRPSPCKLGQRQATDRREGNPRHPYVRPESPGGVPRRYRRCCGDCDFKVAGDSEPHDGHESVLLERKPQIAKRSDRIRRRRRRRPDRWSHCRRRILPPQLLRRPEYPCGRCSRRWEPSSVGSWGRCSPLAGGATCIA